MQDESITFTVELSDAQAWALAQFFKRVGFYDYRALAVDDEQAYAMRHAGDAVRQALRLAGYAPR